MRIVEPQLEQQAIPSVLPLQTSRINISIQLLSKIYQLNRESTPTIELCLRYQLVIFQELLGQNIVAQHGKLDTLEIGRSCEELRAQLCELPLSLTEEL